MTVSAVPLPVWWEQLSHRAEELLGLPVGWDSYSAAAVNPVVIEAAFRFLGRFMADNFPVPQLNPTPVGGVNVEWHLSDVRDIEVEFHHDGEMEAIVVDGDDESAVSQGNRPRLHRQGCSAAPAWKLTTRRRTTRSCGASRAGIWYEGPTEAFGQQAPPSATIPTEAPCQ
jgi:hypothetical protein